MTKATPKPDLVEPVLDPTTLAYIARKLEAEARDPSLIPVILGGLEKRVSGE